MTIPYISPDGQQPQMWDVTPATPDSIDTDNYGTVGSIVARTWYGLEGMAGFAVGVGRKLDTGMGMYGPTPIEDYQPGWSKDAHDMMRKLDEHSLTFGTIGRTAYNVIPTLATVALGSMVDPLVGIGMMGLSSADQTYSTMRANGVDAQTAMNSAAASGIIGAAMGAIPGGALGHEAVATTLKELANQATYGAFEKAMTGAGVGAGMAFADQAAMYTILSNNGYTSMAEDMGKYDIRAIASNALLGGLFSGVPAAKTAMALRIMEGYAPKIVDPVAPKIDPVSGKPQDMPPEDQAMDALRAQQAIRSGGIPTDKETLGQKTQGVTSTIDDILSGRDPGSSAADETMRNRVIPDPAEDSIKAMHQEAASDPVEPGLGTGPVDVAEKQHPAEPTAPSPTIPGMPEEIQVGGLDPYPAGAPFSHYDSYGRPALPPEPGELQPVHLPDPLPTPGAAGVPPAYLQDIKFNPAPPEPELAPGESAAKVGIKDKMPPMPQVRYAEDGIKMLNGKYRVASRANRVETEGRLSEAWKNLWDSTARGVMKHYAGKLSELYALDAPNIDGVHYNNNRQHQVGMSITSLQGNHINAPEETLLHEIGHIMDAEAFKATDKDAYASGRKNAPTGFTYEVAKRGTPGETTTVTFNPVAWEAINHIDRVAQAMKKGKDMEEVLGNDTARIKLFQNTWYGYKDAWHIYRELADAKATGVAADLEKIEAINRLARTEGLTTTLAMHLANHEAQAAELPIGHAYAKAVMDAANNGDTKGVQSVIRGTQAPDSIAAEKFQPTSITAPTFMTRAPLERAESAVGAGDYSSKISNSIQNMIDLANQRPDMRVQAPDGTTMKASEFASKIKDMFNRDASEGDSMDSILQCFRSKG